MNRTRFQISEHVCIFNILQFCQELYIFLLGNIEGYFEFFLLPTLVDTVMKYDNNQLTMKDTMNESGNNQTMLPSNNPVSKVNNGSKTKNEPFTDTLEWCCQALELDKFPLLLGRGACNAATTCTYRHALRPQDDGQESTALHMIDRWS